MGTYEYVRAAFDEHGYGDDGESLDVQVLAALKALSGAHDQLVEHVRVQLGYMSGDIEPIQRLFAEGVLDAEKDNGRLAEQVQRLNQDNDRLRKELAATLAELQPHLLADLRAKIAARAPERSKEES